MQQKMRTVVNWDLENLKSICLRENNTAFSDGVISDDKIFYTQIGRKN